MSKSRSRSSKRARQGGDRPAQPEGGSEPRAIDKARAANKARGGGGGRPSKGAAARRKVERRRRQQTLIYSGVAVAVVAILVAVIVLDRQEEGATDDEFQQAQEALASARETAGCTEIQEHAEASRTHIPPSQAPGDWNSNPPSSGEHWFPDDGAGWVHPGFYEEEQDERKVVHSLEHGYVAVQYKGISDDQIEQLRALQEEHDGQKLVVQPYEGGDYNGVTLPGLESDGVALSAWQHTQTCDQVNIDVIQGFIDGFMLPTGRQSVAPEPEAA